MRADFIAKVRQSAIAGFDRRPDSAPGPPSNFSDYAMNLMQIAERDAVRLVNCWQADNLQLDSEQRLNLFYEFTLFYLHLSDRYVAEHGASRREEVMATVSNMAWYSYLSSSVAESLPDDLASDPAIIENWRGFLQDLQLRHQMYERYVWLPAQDTDPSGTLIWEFAIMVARLFGRPDDRVAVTCILSATEGSLADLNLERLLD
jgi:hypothetical protein